MDLRKLVPVNCMACIGVFSMLALCMQSIFAVTAHADLMVTPRRIVLDDRKTDATLHLLNNSDEPRTYELGWTQMKMDEAGKLVGDPDPLALGGASSFVVANPRRVTLNPGESQTVRLRTRMPAELPFGEYISHLSFSPLGKAPSTENHAGEGAVVEINVRIGVAVPVIVRHGELTASADVQIAGLDIQAGVIKVNMIRHGNAGIIGNLEGYWGQPGQSGVSIAQLNGVAIYPNLERSHREIPLNLPEGFKFEPGMLHVIYRNPTTQEIMAQSTVRLE